VDLPASSSRDRILQFAVPALMVVVAAIGTIRHMNLDQPAWRGATIGMFAHIDGVSNRFVRGTVTGDDGQPQLAVPPRAARDEADRALVIPTTNNLRALEQAWRAADPDAELVRVEVLGTVFDGDVPSVTMEVVAAYEPDDADAADEEGEADA
jgi:hypothetical protein